MEKSQEIEKHYKVQENLKILYAYIKKIRNQPLDDYTEVVNNHKDLSIKQGDLSKSDRGTTKRSETSKRSRRTNNRSRLYENEHKLFEQMLKGKNNQSLDTTANKKQTKHIKYTTLLSKDKNGGINSTSNTAQIIQKDKSRKHDDKKLDIENSKSSNYAQNKYFSAPVSTKENGLVTKFKFNDKQTKDVKRIEEEKSQKLVVKSNTTENNYEKVSEHVSDQDTSMFKKKFKSEESDDDKKGHPEIDAYFPKHNDIQKIFSDACNSPSEKIIHMSVINSSDNFEEFKRDRDQQDHEETKDSKDIKDREELKEDSSKDKISTKAAVPILDFTHLSQKDKKEESKSNENEDREVKSNSVVSIFDQESHLDLSSKRLKKLILTSDFSSLLNLREEALKFREDKERDKINKLIKNSKISPRTGKNRTIELEKWITKEKEEICKTKKIIDEARKKTEDVIKEAQINADFLKQILSEKVMTPREGMSVRSGLNSSRKQYELLQKYNKSEHEGSEYCDYDRSSIQSDKMVEFDKFDKKYLEDLNHKEIDQYIDRFANKEIEIIHKNNGDKSDLDAMLSVDTPKIGSDQNSSFNGVKRVQLGPLTPQGDSSSDTEELTADKNIPINFEVKIKDDPSADKSDSSEPLNLNDQKDQNLLSLSRKKSEQRLTDLNSKFAQKPEESKGKPTITPPPQTKPSLLNPFNSDHFFTHNFDEQEMDAAIEQLKNSSGKMGDYAKYEDQDSNEDLQYKDQDKNNLMKTQKFDSLDPKDQYDLTLMEPEKDEFTLIREVERNKMVKNKESRNVDIKDNKNKDNVEKQDDKDKKKYYGINDDVEFLKKKNTVKPTLEDSRNDKRIQSNVQKSSKTSESIKEDIILDEASDKDNISDLDVKDDQKNITGSQSLDGCIATTPDKVVSPHGSDYDISDKTDNLNNSDSKYATVSILTELNKKNQEIFADNSLETLTANKLTDLIYSAMLAEIKAELFPPRPLFLLTADLDKIDLEQALFYLNEMSAEKEQALLKEYLKYSAGDDMDLHSWEGDRHDRDSDESKMFSDSGKLVLYERKGISTDLFSIEKYVDELCDEVDRKCKSKFLTDTFTPIKKNSLELLNQLQNSDIGSYEHFETDLNSIAILPLEVYLELEKKRKSKELDEQKQEETISSEESKRKKAKTKEITLLRECEHIHNKALFDSINESLLQFKPYGKDGEPMPWSRKQRKLQKTPIQRDIDIKKMFEIIKHDMFRWSIMQAGTLPRREFIFSGVFDEELFAEIREKKLATLLATEVIENEYKWLNYDFEEAQVRIDLGDMILEHLVTEAISLSGKIEENANNQKSIYTDNLTLVCQSDDEDNEPART